MSNNNIEDAKKLVRDADELFDMLATGAIDEEQSPSALQTIHTGLGIAHAHLAVANAESMEQQVGVQGDLLATVRDEVARAIRAERNEGASA